MTLMQVNNLQSTCKAIRWK